VSNGTFFPAAGTRYTEQFTTAAIRHGWERLEHEVHRPHEIPYRRAKVLILIDTVLLDKSGLLRPSRALTLRGDPNDHGGGPFLAPPHRIMAQEQGLGGYTVCKRSYTLDSCSATHIRFTNRCVFVRLHGEEISRAFRSGQLVVSNGGQH
jgi:hypothetical protein